MMKTKKTSAHDYNDKKNGISYKIDHETNYDLDNLPYKGEIMVDNVGDLWTENQSGQILVLEKGETEWTIGSTDWTIVISQYGQIKSLSSWIVPTVPNKI